MSKKIKNWCKEHQIFRLNPKIECPMCVKSLESNHIRLAIFYGTLNVDKKIQDLSEYPYGLTQETYEQIFGEGHEYAEDYPM